MLGLLLGRWANIYLSSLLLSLLAFQRLYVIPVLDREKQSNRWGLGRYLGWWLTWICCFGMLTSGVIWLWAVIASISNSGIELGTAGKIVAVTQFGRLWLFRSFLGLAIVGGLLHDILRKTARKHSDLFWIAVAAINLASLAWASHAGATTGSFANFHLLTDLVHLLTSAVWPGSLLPLVVWFLVSARGRGNESVDCAVVHRFSAISMGAVVVLAVSGLLNSLFMLKRFSDFFSTTYGQILAGKIILFLIMIGLGRQNRRLLKIQQPSAAPGMDPSKAGRLFRNVCAESALAFIVFGLAGALGAIEPPN
jgi:putative copper export protein